MPDEVLKYLRRTSRRIGACRVIEAAGLGVIVGGLAAAGGQIVFWLAGRPHRAAGIMILAAGLLAGAIVALIKGVSLRQAAGYVDSRATLDERLTTAVELAAAGDSSPAAQYVAFTSMRRTPTLDRSVEDPMVVVKTLPFLPGVISYVRVQATGIIGLFFLPVRAVSVGFMPVSTCPYTRGRQPVCIGRRTV